MPLDPKVLRDIYGETMVNPMPDARGINPDQAAEGIKINRSTGIDAVLAAESLPQLQGERDAEDWNKLVKTSPMTAKFIAKSRVNAAVSQDNLGSMGMIEQALRNTGNAAVSGLRGASAGAVGILRTPLDLLGAIEQPMSDYTGQPNLFSGLSNRLGNYQSGISGRAKAEMPKGDSILGSGYYSGIASLSRNLAAMPMAFLPGGQKAALGTMVAPVYGESYAQARDAGRGLASSMGFAGSQATIEYVTEKIPLGKLMGDLKVGESFGKVLLNNVAREVPGEQLATVLQDMNEWAVINPEKPFSEYLAERPSAAAQTLVATLVGTGGQVTVMKGIEKAIGFADGQTQKAQQAEQNTAFIENLNKLAAADKLLQRDPETFQSFIAAATEDGPVQTIYIDAQSLMQTGLGRELMQASPAVAAQLDTAIATGGQVAIPVDEYATRIAPTEFAPQLLDHLKTEAEGFSRFEAQTYMAESANDMQAEIERSIADSQNKDEFRASQDRVKQTVLDNLNQVGRFSPQKNEFDATLIAARSAVRAQQLGMTPEEFFTKQVLRVQGERGEGMQYDQTGNLQTDTPAFANWFGESQVVDAEGKPLVVYHGAPDARFMQEDATFKTVAEKYGEDQPDKRAFWFASDKRTANTYADDRRAFDYQNAEPGIVEAYISLNNPLIIEAGGKEWREAQARGKTSDVIQQAREGGHDGVIIRNVRDDYNNQTKTKATDTYVVFSSNQIKSSTGNRGTFDPTDPNILHQSANQTETAAFNEWAGTDEPVIAPDEINDHDFSGPGPFVMRAYHGTTHTFDEFIAALNGNMEGQFGAVNYFTSSEQDASDNYAGEGPDLTQRIELKAERLADELTTEYEEAGNDAEGVAALKERYGEDVYSEDMMTMARNIVRNEMHGGDEVVMELFIKSERPFVVNDEQSPWFEFMDEGEIESLAIARVADNEGLSVDDIESSRDDYQDQIDDARYEVMDEQENPLIEAVQIVADKYEFDAGELLSSLYEVTADGSIKHSNLEEMLRENQSLSYAENPENGDIIQSHMIGEIIQQLGFDSIILKNANERFKNMNMEQGTAHIHVFDANNTNIKSVENQGTFDPANPNIYMQPDGGASPRGAYSPEQNIITLLNNADLSTFLHEGAHYFFENDINLAAELAGKTELTAGEQKIVNDVSALLAWHGIQGDINEQLRQWYGMDFDERRAYHERTAESFERYLLEGKAPSIELQSAFQTFRSWMISVYKSLKDFLARNPEAGKLSDEVRGIFDRMLATDEQIALAEQGRSMMALFTEPLGMTPDEFAAYQSLGTDATATAMDELQAKGVRDMQWMGNKRGKAIAKLQREAKALRAEAMLEARREVMSQPVYRAWDFLTRKQTADDKLPPLERKSDPDILDPEIDSLFVAIAKMGGIKKDQVLSEWGIDPKDIPQSGLFGKPVWRLTEGSTIDLMAQSLSHHGYLPVNEHGQYELNDLADRFMAELAGEPQYSHAKKYDDLRPGEQIANPGGLGAGKLDIGALGAMGYDTTQIELLKARRMTASEGLHPDMAANVLEFDSGDEMVRNLLDAIPPKEAIAAMTDQIMLQRHGELATPEAIATAADMAIHNEVRARFITTEANALARAVGKPKLLASAAKAFAAEQIARQKVRDLKPGLYTNAETKAAKGAEKAMKAGDTALAAAEKRNQAINVYLARATYEAKDDVESGIRYLKKFDKPSKKIDPEYMDQIEAMLERFDLRAKSLKSIDKRVSFAQWLASQREQGIEPDVPEGLENEANRTHYKNLSVEEFRGLIDTVKQIEHLGRLKNKLLTAQDQREFGAIVNEVSASIIENGGPERPVELEQPGRFKEFIENFRAGHRKLASLIRQMDGDKDSGPFWRVFVRGMNEAGTAEASMVENATVRLMEIYQPMLALKGGLDGDKRFIPEINTSLTRAGRLSIALNWGNETNRLRVMEGDQWSEQQVQAILNTMTRAEWQFVQDAWGFIDSYWPLIEAKEKRVTGRAPDKVQALPFTVMVGGENVNLTGGYYPIKYDSNRDDRAEKHEAAEIAEEMKRGAYTRASTRRGHTKARTESVKRPIKKTLDVITQHVGEVTHDLAWHEWLIDANRLLDAKPINQAIRTHYGTAVVRTMKDALIGIAAGDMARQTALDTALLYLRANVSRSTMGFSLTTAFLQPFGLLQSVVRVGAKPVIHGIGRWAGDVAKMESTMTWVGEKSEFMRLRGKTFNRELNEIRNRVSKGRSKIRTVYDASLFMLMQKMQMVADIPTWIGVYDQAIANGMEESDAVALADQSVLDSQGGGQNKDMAEIQRKHPMLSMFYSYFNTTLNLVEESTAKTNFRDPLAVAGWVSDMMLLMVVPALGPAMILALMRGEKCWEEGDCAREMAQAQLGYTLGTVVGVREMSGMAEGYDYAGPPVGRVIVELGRVGTQAKQGEADEAAAMATVRLFGTALGIPTTQIIRSYRGWQAWADGDAPVTSILMGPPRKD